MISVGGIVSGRFGFIGYFLLTVSLLDPIKIPLVLGPAFRLHQALKQANLPLIVRRLAKLKTPRVGHESRELFGKFSTQVLYFGLLLHLANLSIPVFDGVGFEALPRQTTPQKIHEHVSHRVYFVHSPNEC